MESVKEVRGNGYCLVDMFVLHPRGHQIQRAGWNRVLGVVVLEIAIVAVCRVHDDHHNLSCYPSRICRLVSGVGNGSVDDHGHEGQAMAESDAESENETEQVIQNFVAFGTRGHGRLSDAYPSPSWETLTLNADACACVSFLSSHLSFLLSLSSL